MPYSIDFKALFAQAPDPKPRNIAYLNLLIHRPAVPELDGTKPYQEMLLAYALSGDQEPEGHTVWDCFDDHSRWHEGIDALADQLKKYDLTVTFTPNEPFGYKVFNLYKVLENAQMLSSVSKNSFNCFMKDEPNGEQEIENREIN